MEATKSILNFFIIVSFLILFYFLHIIKLSQRKLEKISQSDCIFMHKKIRLDEVIFLA